jgi:hypothetical protein
MYPTGNVTALSTFVQAQHIVELRRGLDALRTLVNLPQVFVSQAAPSGSIMATYLIDLLAPLDAARAPFGHVPFVYSNGIPRPAPGVAVKAGQITQLREVLK